MQKPPCHVVISRIYFSNILIKALYGCRKIVENEGLQGPNHFLTRTFPATLVTYEVCCNSCTKVLFSCEGPMDPTVLSGRVTKSEMCRGKVYQCDTVCIQSLAWIFYFLNFQFGVHCDAKKCQRTYRKLYMNGKGKVMALRLIDFAIKFKRVISAPQQKHCHSPCP
jgi:hypothetical protein